MRNYILDIETVPLPEDELLKLMPLSIANPVMPEEVRNPVMPDFEEGCPAYKTKAFPEGDPEKKGAYVQKKHDDWIAKTESARNRWEERAVEAKQKFIDNAALSAQTGRVKLIGIRDYTERKSHVFIAGALPAQERLLYDGTYPGKIEFHFCDDEREMLDFIADLIMSGEMVPGNADRESPFRIVTFYGNLFDLPFLLRRSWITGARSPMTLRKGRFFTDTCMDLLEVWQLGDRQETVGGMDGLARVLGTKRKTGSGEGFHRLWNENPVAAVIYLMDDLDVAEGIGERMSVLYVPPPMRTNGTGKGFEPK